MSNQLLSKEDIPVLKRQAKAIKRRQGITHAEALDQVARQYGFNAWSHLQSSTPDSVKTDTAETLLRAFFDGCREERHLKMVIVLWEHFGHTTLVNRLLAELNFADESALGEIYFNLKNESPQKLYNAIEKARYECFKADQEDLERQFAHDEAAYDAFLEKQFGQYEEEQAREEMGMSLSKYPPHTQETILNHQFNMTGIDAPLSLHQPWVYYEHHERVDSVLMLIDLLHDCMGYSSDFDSPESLDKWLVTPFDPAQKESLCPLDALGSDVALEFLSAFVAKIDEETADPRTETAVNYWVDRWMAEPHQILPEHRHLLDKKEAAKLHFKTLRESARQVILQQLGDVAL